MTSPEFVRVASIDQIPPGQLFWTEIDGREVVVVNLDGELFALDNTCQHAGGPLDRGKLDEAGCITCPWHGWKWDVRTGRPVWPALDWRTRRYPVRIEGRNVLVGREFQ